MMRLGIYVSEGLVNLGYFWGCWVFLLGRGLRILVYIGLNWDENMVLSYKLALGELDGIVGGLLGLPSEGRMGGTGTVKNR